MTIKEDIANALDKMLLTGIKNPDKGNVAKLLFDIHCWQEIKAYAEAEEKKAWARGAKVLDDDDTMRALGVGEHTIQSTTCFVCVAKVSSPRNNLDQDVLTAKIARKFKITPAAARAIVDSAKVPGKPSLSKRVLEA